MSYLRRLNTTAPLRPVNVSDELISLLCADERRQSATRILVEQEL